MFLKYKTHLRAKKAVDFDNLLFTTVIIETNKGCQKWKVNNYAEASVFLFLLSAYFKKSNYRITLLTFGPLNLFINN